MPHRHADARRAKSAADHGLDIGIVLLTGNQQDLLAANGVVAIAEAKWEINGKFPFIGILPMIGTVVEFYEDREIRIPQSETGKCCRRPAVDF